MKRIATILVSIMILAVGAPHARAYRVTETWHETVTPADGIRFVLENRSGSIVIEGWDRRVIDITAEVRIKATSKDLANQLYREIEFDIESGAKRLEVGTRLPRMRQTGYGIWGEHTSITIRYTIKVPHRTDLEIETVNGDIGMRRTEGAFELETANGSIELSSLGGEGRAVTGNGSISCRVEKFPPQGELELKAVNGSLKVRLPEDVGAQLEARVTNGKVEVDLPLHDIERRKRSSIEARLGAGDGRIVLKAISGNIRVRPL